MNKKKIKGLAKTILGSFIIAMAMNLFFSEYNIIPNGMLGFSLIYSIKVEFSLAYSLLLVNVFFLMLGYLTIPKKKLIKAVLPSLLVPLFVYLSTPLIEYVDLSSAEMLLITIFGSVLIGFGNKFIYHSEHLSGSSDIIEIISEEIIGHNGKNVNYIIDAVLVLFAYLNFGLETMLYSIVAIAIIELMSKRSTLGVSEEKLFYIITKEDVKVKKFIINELHYDLTIFDVKGGFSQNKSKVLMSAIPTKDYYKLREGIKEIDPSAFIAITDSYEVINDNVSINK